MALSWLEPYKVLSLYFRGRKLRIVHLDKCHVGMLRLWSIFSPPLIYPFLNITSSLSPLELTSKHESFAAPSGKPE